MLVAVFHGLLAAGENRKSVTKLRKMKPDRLRNRWTVASQRSTVDWGNAAVAAALDAAAPVAAAVHPPVAAGSDCWPRSTAEGTHAYQHSSEWHDSIQPMHRGSKENANWLTLKEMSHDTQKLQETFTFWLNNINIANCIYTSILHLLIAFSFIKLPFLRNFA